MILKIWKFSFIWKIGFFWFFFDILKIVILNIEFMCLWYVGFFDELVKFEVLYFFVN